MAESAPDELSVFVSDLIEGLRPKLLDLSRRNPLLSAPFSERSHALIRVVDEVPTVLFEKLVTGSMRLVALPPLDEDPKDEQTREFQSALSEARLNDEAYITSLDEVDEDADDSAERLIRIERELKDRIRESLGLPLRQTKGNLSLAQHAKNNHIRPSYELPLEDAEDDDGRHTDDDIQTLLLPDLFERRLNSIGTKCRTWLQETGISVFQVAFGFLEWAETENSKSSFAPLILMPAELVKNRTRTGAEFLVSGDENVENNVVIAEKFRIDFNIDFPQYEAGTPIEEYFKSVADAAPAGRKWRVRHQIAIGVFPSARMAMYHDLDTSKWSFGEHEVMLDLFGGNSETTGSSPFGEEYMVDDPKIEAKVPILVTEADSSQFSTIVDVMDNKNLAVEGPPGTGKSQTIVNTIAGAIYAGKKVLFVAEKTAALDVVRARLDALDLGDFILPLLANRSGKAQVIQSIRDRMETPEIRNPAELDEKIERFRAIRSDISSYIDVIGSKFGETGLTVFDVLGRRILLSEELNKLPEELLHHSWPTGEKITDTQLKKLRDIADDIERVSQNCKKLSDLWKRVNICNIDPFIIGETLDAADQCALAYSHSLKVREGLNSFDLNSDVGEESLRDLHLCLQVLGSEISVEQGNIAKSILLKGAIEDVEKFLGRSQKARDTRSSLEEICLNPLAEGAAEKINKLADVMDRIELPAISMETIGQLAEDRQARAAKLRKAISIIDEVIIVFPEASEIIPRLVFKACEIAGRISREALALRNEKLEGPLAWEVIEKAHSKVKHIKDTRIEIEKMFVLNGSLNHEDVTKQAGSIATAGMFSFLSKDFRKAKKFYRSISTKTKFNKNDSLRELRELSSWLTAVWELENDRKLEGLLGLRFEGVESDFQTINEVAEYYRLIDESLSGAKNKILRKFLKNGSLEDVGSLPSIDDPSLFTVVSKANYQEAKNDLRKMEKSLSELENEMGSLKELLPILRKAEGMTPDSLKSLSLKVDGFQSEWNALENDESIKDMLGNNFFRGAETKRGGIAQTLELAKSSKEISESLGHGLVESYCKGNSSQLDEILGRIFESDEGAQASLDEVASKVETNAEDFRGQRNHQQIIEWMTLASNDRAGLVEYSRLATERTNLSNEGYGFLLEVMDREKDSFAGLANALSSLVANGMAREVYAEHGKTLSKFSGDRLDNLRKRLAEVDREILVLSRSRVRARLVRDSSPPKGVGKGRKKNWTELSLIELEVNKKQRYVSGRELTERAGKALLELKPCWMMSPLAVAQYIEKGSIIFDLVIIDEASQMTPENAIGALVRGKRAMVVGDTNQLPPTSFFKKMIAIDEDEEDEDAVTDESILERANGAFRPARRLRWHYRSRHSGLIAFSNKYVYDNNLMVFPSASEDDPTMGVSYNKIDGLYSSGTNPKEAEAMVDAISIFMREHEDRSLGVVTVNQKQRDLLLEEFEHALSRDPGLMRYIEKWDEKNDGLESFFIKNLENVQGDERDVIFIGTVYGPENAGAPVMQRFGPISGVAGKRRLNVLFTRAKLQVVTFSSMTAADIRAEEGQNQGAYLLKKWLEYSASGILDSGSVTMREADSDFEEHVSRQITSIGCEVIPQVGVAGYFIDIGIKHPNWPHGFIMGVECDGATYHSSKSARDRDRLRQEVLEGLGWHLHRIWSTDWFENPAREAERVRLAIEERLFVLLSGKAVSAIKPAIIISETEEGLIGESSEENEEEEIDEDCKEKAASISAEEARELLWDLRDGEIADEFPTSDRSKGILRKSMLNAFLEHLPTDEAEFRSLMPLGLRETTDPRQTKYLGEILEIIALVDS